MRAIVLLHAALWLSTALLGGCATQGALAPSASGASLLQARAEQQTAAHWIARQRDADRVRLDAAAITAQNARMLALDPSLHDLAALPATLPRAEVDAAIRALSAPPSRALFDEHGAQLSAIELDALQDALALDTIPASIEPVFALVTRRADMRTFPTTRRVFSDAAVRDIDRFQENALFPGTPVAMLHTSRDGAWTFATSTTYRAWMPTDALARSDHATVLDFADRTPFRLVTGATATTAFTRDAAALSQLQLDMGVRLPLWPDWPADAPVHGQHPQGSHVLTLPTRAADGSLAFTPALLPATADSSDAPLPYTPANVLRQSFRFLGERYGWGHADGTRDCSGFVSEVYRSLGLLLPRNTGDQARSPALDRIAFSVDDDAAHRRAVLQSLDVGDLVYVPGHVMLVIGHEHGHTFVIHDTAGVHLRDATGALQRIPVNGVVVTPLEPLLDETGAQLLERITAIQRVRPPSNDADRPIPRRDAALP